MSNRAGGLAAAGAGACALALAMGIGRFAYTPMLPAMLEEASLGLSAAGLVASANFLGYLIGALLATRAVFARRRTTWLRTGLALSALTTAAMALDIGPSGWASVRLASGVASAFVLVFTSGIVFEIAAREGRPMLGSLLYAGVGVGIAASALLVFAGREAGWSAARLWWALAGLSSLLALAPWRVLDLPSDTARPPPHADAARRGAIGVGEVARARDEPPVRDRAAPDRHRSRRHGAPRARRRRRERRAPSVGRRRSTRCRRSGSSPSAPRHRGRSEVVPRSRRRSRR